MKKEIYRQWLENQKYQANTIAAQLHRASKVEEHYGSLDDHFESDRLQSVINHLRYSAHDRKMNRPNPSKLNFKGDVFNNLSSYRNATERYRKFRSIEVLDGPLNSSPTEPYSSTPAPSDIDGQRIGLERDMQAALRREIHQLEVGLSIIDDGAERSVDSGFIDITAKDSENKNVVIELKTGVAGQRAVAQILSYMGDLATEEPETNIRGILVASDFDQKAKSAARMVPTLTLKKYSVRFLFSEGAD